MTNHPSRKPSDPLPPWHDQTLLLWRDLVAKVKTHDKIVEAVREEARREQQRAARESRRLGKLLREARITIRARDRRIRYLERLLDQYERATIPAHASCSEPQRGR